MRICFHFRGKTQHVEFECLQDIQSGIGSWSYYSLNCKTSISHPTLWLHSIEHVESVWSYWMELWGWGGCHPPEEPCCHWELDVERVLCKMHWLRVVCSMRRTPRGRGRKGRERVINTGKGPWERHGMSPHEVEHVLLLCRSHATRHWVFMCPVLIAPSWKQGRSGQFIEWQFETCDS